MDDKKLKELVIAAMQNNQQAVQAIQQIMQAAQQGDPQAAELAKKIQAIINTMKQEQTRMAKFGAKLNYIRYLKGKCPQGYETQYFKKGGKVCKSCVKKDMEAATVDQFKSKRVRKAFQGQAIPKEEEVISKPRNFPTPPYYSEAYEEFPPRVSPYNPIEQPSTIMDPRDLPILPTPPIQAPRNFPTSPMQDLKRGNLEKFKKLRNLGSN